MPFSITGSGIIDLRSTLLQGDGLTFDTSGPATAQVNASQFGVDPGDVALDGTITGSQFADKMEFFVNQSSFSAGSLSFANWSANDSLIFRAMGSVTVAATALRDTFIYGGGVSHFNAGAGDDVLVADYSFTTNGYAVNTYTFSADANGYSGDLTTGGWVQGRVSFNGVNRFDYTGTQYGDDIRTGDNADTINGGAGNDTISSGKGADVIDGGSGAGDKWIADKSGDGVGQGMSLNTRTNTYSGPGSVTNIESVQLSLGAGNDRVITSVGNVTTADGDLNDTILGGGGDDTVGVAQGEDRFEGGAGNDLLIADFSAVTTYALSSGGDFAPDASGYSGQFFTGGRIEGAVVFTGVDRFNITGTKFDDELRTGDNADTLTGGAGNDTLSSGKGADVIDGGAGAGDKWIADKSGDGAGQALSLNTRTNTYSGPGSVANIESVHLSLGAGNDQVITSIGNVTTASGDLNDTILGGGGDDTVSVAQGEDRFEGGAGNDLLIADFSAVTTYALSSGGDFAPDASGYSGQFFTGGRIEGAVVFTGVERFNVTGTKLDDAIRTGDNSDTVNGGAGNDYINTGKGTDIVDGGAGTADKWVADKSADGAGKAMALNMRTNAYSGPGSVSNIESAELSLGAGNDRIITSVGALNDTILGGGGNDTVSVAQGEDRFEGGAGIDTLIADFSGATTYALSSGGSFAPDASGYSGQFFTGGRLEGAVVFTGVDRFNIRGTQFGDNIVTGGNADLLHGESGNDTLNGGGGADTMNGGRGSDTYLVDNTRDVTNETVAGAAGGVDTVYSQVSRTLGANIENLVLEGTAVTGIGNTGANRITGNARDNKIDGGEGNDTLDGVAGADELRGGLGADSMTGGLGSDRYFVDNANDVIVEATADLATGGNDTVYSLIDYTLGANLEILRLQGSAGLSAAGNQLNNRVSGNSGANLVQGLDGNDVLEGKDGADTLVGGTGNDTMTGGSHADVFRFASSNTGVDTITDFSRNGDRFDLSGGSFTALSIAPNGDAVLTHAGGAIRVQSPPNLTLAQWNALVLPSGSAADYPLADALHDHAGMLAGPEVLQAGSLDWAFG